MRIMRTILCVSSVSIINMYIHTIQGRSFNLSASPLIINAHGEQKYGAPLDKAFKMKCQGKAGSRSADPLSRELGWAS